LKRSSGVHTTRCRQDQPIVVDPDGRLRVPFDGPRIMVASLTARSPRAPLVGSRTADSRCGQGGGVGGVSSSTAFDPLGCRRRRQGVGQSDVPVPQPTRPTLSRCSATSRPSGPTSKRSATRSSSTTRSRPCASSTTPSGSTPASATSPPTTNTKDEEQPSARPDARGCVAHDNSASPTVARTRPAGPDRGREFLRRDAALAQTHLRNADAEGGR
jgi:hypothetical protein